MAGAIVFAILIMPGVASAATVSGKDGMQSTGGPIQDDRHVEGDGLPMFAPGVQELSLGGQLNWEDSTTYNFDISYGRFITANWLFVVQVGITGINSDKDYRLGKQGSVCKS